MAVSVNLKTTMLEWHMAGIFNKLLALVGPPASGSPIGEPDIKLSCMVLAFL